MLTKSQSWTILLLLFLSLLPLSAAIAGPQTRTSHAHPLVFVKDGPIEDTSSPVDQTYTIHRIIKNISARRIDAVTIGVVLHISSQPAKTIKWTGGPLKPGATEAMDITAPVKFSDHAGYVIIRNMRSSKE
jgi:hypothetical protein